MLLLANAWLHKNVRKNIQWDKLQIKFLWGGGNDDHGNQKKKYEIKNSWDREKHYFGNTEHHIQKESSEVH